MSKESVTLKIDALEVKIKKLLEQHHMLKENLKESQSENQVLRKQLELKDDELKNFQNQFKISKIAHAVSDDKRLTYEYKIKINEYLKEIEKGLAYLNRI